MAYKGHVENGVVVLDEPADLSDGDEVSVYPLRRRKPAGEDRQVPTLYERLKDIIGSVEGLPPDFARNHDHYIHGQPKEGCVLRTRHTKCQSESDVRG
ncbi:MAG TPA: hypothetical protein VNE39_07310 [Planctomycetota bacterium]|nr:hypothetical protein [Planctomycetota bacterium]